MRSEVRGKKWKIGGKNPVWISCIAAVATWPAAQAESDKVHAVRLMSLLQLGCLGNGRKARETRSDNYLGKTISKSCVFIPSNRIAPSTQHIIQKVNF